MELPFVINPKGPVGKGEQSSWVEEEATTCSRKTRVATSKLYHVVVCVYFFHGTGIIKHPRKLWHTINHPQGPWVYSKAQIQSGLQWVDKLSPSQKVHGSSLTKQSMPSSCT